MCILERESILEQNGEGSLALLSHWLLLKVLEVKFLKDSQSRWRLKIANRNKQLQTNK
jgi:hypothetical protein